VLNLQKDLRPISLTPCVAKIAEGFVVEDFVKPAILKVIDDSQYGAIPHSSTTMALISMLHQWSTATDGNKGTVRTLLFDYRKAFDLVDHSILVCKLCRLDLPSSIINWVIDFLSNRLQRIKLAGHCFSEWGPVPSGIPQGTKLGPWLFVLMINDLKISSPYLWKFVDDTSASEVIPKGGVSRAQVIANDVMNWSKNNRVQLNPDKCKEFRITFARKQETIYEPIVVDGKELELVNNTKLLGVIISNNLTWNDHINEVIRKVSKRLYFLIQLKRANVAARDLVLFYSTCIRSIIDYAIPVFYHALPQYLKEELIRLEKRAVSIILPGLTYSLACIELGIKPISDHHKELCSKRFNSIVNNSNHKLHSLLPPKNNPKYHLRNQRVFNVPNFKTKRTKNTFINKLASSYILNYN